MEDIQSWLLTVIGTLANWGTPRKGKLQVEIILYEEELMS